jgi:diguanylate cyclase (GGDEF)-like protein
VAATVLRPSATLTAYALVADRDFARASSYRETLEQLNLETIVTRDGREALEIMERHGAPVILVADVSLPQTDGLEVVRAMRQLAPGRRAAAIVMSSFGELRAFASSFQSELQVSDVLRHSVSPAEFKTAVEAALGSVEPGIGSFADLRSRATAGDRLPATVEEIVGLVVSECVEAFPELAVTLYLQLGDQKWFRSALKSPAGLSTFPSLAALVRRVFDTGETLILPDVASTPPWHERSNDPGAQGLIAVPVGPTRDRAVGVLYLSGPDALRLPPYDLDLLQGIARRAGAALRPHVTAPAEMPATVRLSQEQFERLSREAMEDPLTGLTNRHGAEIAMGRELARAKRERRALSLALIDVDDFKQVNDRQGHAVGDRVLRSVARIATDCVRASDLVVRWGGDEFLVVLPSVTVSGAREIAERIRSRVETMPTEPSGITISAGACEVQPGDDLPSALSDADVMLHRAKAEGRNRVF